MINTTIPYLPDFKKYSSYLKFIYDKKWLTNNGELVQELTSQLEGYLGVRNLLLVSSGTMALSIAYKLLKLKKTVVTTPFSFVATTSSLVWDGITPEFCDVQKATFNMDASKLHLFMKKSVEAILPVHVFGNPCDIDKIQDVACKYNKKVIYDASHCFDVKYKNKSVLSYGDISTISFHATKIFHTVEGGALVINNDELFEEAKALMNFGYNGSDEIATPGINGKMSEFHAAMGLSILDDMNLVIKNCKEIYDYYYQHLGGILKFQKYSDCATRNYAYAPVVFDLESDLLAVLKKLNDNDIFPRRYFHPSLDTLNYVGVVEKCHVSQDLSKTTLCLPIYDGLKLKDVNQVVKIVKSHYL
jgi:dTDP-4-amino-4,6-dideoxygalactose transaminase